jgi:hypothetical protein
VAAAAATMLFMAHHPTSAHDGAHNQIVHGVLITLTGLSAYGFLHWSRMRGLERPAVAAALVAYGIGLFGHVGAALISGFVVTALAHDGGAGPDAHLLAFEFHRALAQLGAVAAGAAYALWSVDLIRRGRGAERALGLAGLAAGLVPTGLLIAGMLRMNLAGATIVYGVQLAWMAALGLLMLSASRRSGGVASSRV